MYRPYWAATTDFVALQVMLEEARVPFERVATDLAASEHRAPEYPAINPVGAIFCSA